MQTPPFTINIEPTEGCNLGCSFCGLHGMRKKGTKPWKFMTVETAERIASEIQRVGWNAKIVFANHGEPTLNPDLIQIITIFREKLPKAIFHMYTNGIVLSNSKHPNKDVKAIFEAGINNILIDCYSEKSFEFIERINHDNVVVLEPGVEYYTKKREQRILLVPSIVTDNKNHATRRLANHAGAAAPLDRSFNNKRCAMPFRELTFRWDGNVALCCDDFRGAYPIANIYDMNIEDIWNHPRFEAARIMLYNYDRNFNPCDGCTNMSVRVGFLPDPSGKESLPAITDKVRKLAQSVHKENGYLSDIIVKRPWEEDDDE